MVNHSKPLNTAISFARRLASSERFDTLFRDGMGLVEDTAAYLDGVGRDEARHLPRLTALAYASESMRLTTRLMQIASWLLLQRAVNEGEMTQAEALSDKGRTRVSWKGSSAASSDPALPATLLELSEKSLRLQERIMRLDALIVEPAGDVFVPQKRTPLQEHMDLLQSAFPGPSLPN